MAYMCTETHGYECDGCGDCGIVDVDLGSIENARNERAEAKLDREGED